VLQQGGTKSMTGKRARRDGSGVDRVFLLTLRSSNISHMKMNFKEIGKRITGISVPFFGVSWNPPESERKVAKRIMSFLEDRRVLYSPYDMEMPTHCVESINEIRRYLTDEIGSLASGSELETNLRALRASCRKFLDKTQDHKHEMRYLRPPFDNISSWIFISGLGELRGVFGIHIAKIAVSYGLDIEKELATIIPIVDEE
jgi:hypothetical protein